MCQKMLSCEHLTVNGFIRVNGAVWCQIETRVAHTEALS